jgi:hypothetical protein
VQMLKKPDRWVHAYNRIYHVLARHKNVSIRSSLSSHLNLLSSKLPTAMGYAL